MCTCIYSTGAENDIGLPPEVLDLVLPQLWQKEPYLSAGFVLEGFPTTLDEARDVPLH